MDIIDNLCKNPGPVNGIDGTEVLLFFEIQVVEDGFNNGLTIVEGTADSNVEHIAVCNACHLFFLNLAHPFMWVQDEDVNSLFSPNTINGSTAGVA